MSDSRHTNFVTQAALMGLCNSSGVVTTDLNALQMDELLRTASAAGCKVKFSAPVDEAFDTFVLAPIASQTNTLTVVAGGVSGHALATGIVDVAVSDAAGDTLAVTFTGGHLVITLANTTDSKNTLTLIKAAIDAAVTSATGSCYCFITGTASTQMVHGGTNTLVATAAGGTAGTSLKSSTAGVANSPRVAAGVMTIVTA